MAKNTIFLLLLILFDGVAVIWGIWEFRSARPDKNKKKTADQMTPAPDSPERPGHPER